MPISEDGLHPYGGFSAEIKKRLWGRFFSNTTEAKSLFSPHKETLVTTASCLAKRT